jgi:hypothetical protein
VIVDCAVYEEGCRKLGELELAGAVEASRSTDAFVWIGLYEPTSEEFEAVRQEFALHDLAIEDAISAHQRPKLEVYDESLFIVLKPARYLEAEADVEFGEGADLPRRRFHHHGPPRRGGAPRGAAVDGGATGRDALRSRSGAVCDRRPDRRRLRTGHKRA